MWHSYRRYVLCEPHFARPKAPETGRPSGTVPGWAPEAPSPAPAAPSLERQKEHHTGEDQRFQGLFPVYLGAVSVCVFSFFLKHVAPFLLFMSYVLT